MFVICANSIEEARYDLEAMEAAVAAGKPIALGGVSVDAVKEAMTTLERAVSAATATNPHNCCSCPCDDDEDYCEDEGLSDDEIVDAVSNIIDNYRHGELGTAMAKTILELVQAALDS